MKFKKVAVGVLHIVGPNESLIGDICIHNGIFVVGGKMKNGKVSGYEAIRILLSLAEGTFQYLDYSEIDTPELNNGLKIRLTSLINMLPTLPIQLDELMGANTLNRMRSIDTSEIQTEEALIDKDTFNQLASWEARTMRLRAAAFWGTFLAVTGIACLMYFFQR